MQDLKWHHMADNRVKGVQVPPGYTLQLFDGKTFDGTVESFDGKLDSDGKMACQIVSTLASKVSSAKIWRSKLKFEIEIDLD